MKSNFFRPLNKLIPNSPFRLRNIEAPIYKDGYIPQIKVEAYSRKVIEIDLENEIGSCEEYQAKLGNFSVNVFRTGATAISFLAPFIPNGEYLLYIPGLNNFSAIVVMSELKLNATPDTVIENIRLGIKNHLLSLSNLSEQELLSLQSAYDSFNNMAKNATKEEKYNLALFYEANKEKFDLNLFVDFDKPSNNGMPNLSNFIKFQLSVGIFGGGVNLISFAPGTPEKALATIVALIGQTKAKKNSDSGIPNSGINILNTGKMESQIDYSTFKETYGSITKLENNLASLFYSGKNSNGIIPDGIDAAKEINDYLETFGLYTNSVKRLNETIASLNENLSYFRILPYPDQ